MTKTDSNKESIFSTYYQLTKPGIIYANVMTTAAGFVLASGRHLHFGLMIATLLGTALMIAGACVFNNHIDRGIDQYMERTKQRGTASGQIGGPQAIAYASTLSLMGFGLLVIAVNLLTALIGLTALFIYVIAYGWFKRNSVHGTLVGSLAGAAPPVAGYTAVTNQLSLTGLMLFLVLVCWQMPHFYAIAIFRIEDYQRAGLPVLPIKQGIGAAKQQIMVYILAFLAVSLALAVVAKLTILYWLAMLAVGGYWLIKGVNGFSMSDSKLWARKMFFISLAVLLSWSASVALAGLILG